MASIRGHSVQLVSLSLKEQVFLMFLHSVYTLCEPVSTESRLLGDVCLYCCCSNRTPICTVFSFCQAIAGYGAQDALPFRPIKEGELFFVDDRDVNLVELALATNIPKGCAETMVRGMTADACYRNASH